ncbi:hypothetical protein AB0O75_20435 [Streptomyces sp. NPDC088921]|uniref:hypothetical protein n=1 Tax=unclassified Streptomyces TaxID=2593676 RepID=UPI00342BEA6B
MGAALQADVGLRSGSLAHRHAGLLAARSIHDIMVEAWTLVVRDPSAADNVMGLRTWVHTAAVRGYLDPMDAGTGSWPSSTVSCAEIAFGYAVTYFLTAGTLPLSA